MPKALDLSGQRFGRLTVIARAPNAVHGGQQKVQWHCRCECGTATVVTSGNLRGGNTTSCGCFHQDIRPFLNRTHGQSHKVPEYRIWAHMRQRCVNPTDKRYLDYGGRGIEVCERWNDFSAFLEDMGPRPSDKHSIERIDNDGNYDPNNCRWATRFEQMANTRRNHVITFAGRTMHLSAWARELGIQPDTLERRINFHKWCIERAFTTPINR